MKHIEYTDDELEILNNIWQGNSVSVDHDASASKQQPPTRFRLYHYPNGLVDDEYNPNVCLPYIISTWSNKR